MGAKQKIEDNGVVPSVQDAHCLQPLPLLLKFSLLNDRAEGHCAPLSWWIQVGSQENFTKCLISPCWSQKKSESPDLEKVLRSLDGQAQLNPGSEA